MNMQAMMKQVQKLQEDAAKAQSELDAAKVSGSAGGGAVTIELTGSYKVASISITQEIAETADREMIEDSVRAALEDALERVKSLIQEKMSKAMPNIPGMPPLF